MNIETKEYNVKVLKRLDVHVDHILYRPGLLKTAQELCSGRHDLPLRVMIGQIKGRALRIDKLLGYKCHVAVLGLCATGMHRHDAALLVATRNAGAFCGSPSEFDVWKTQHRVKSDHLIATTLPDKTEWVIWSRDRQPRTKLVPAVSGWQQGFVDFDDLLGWGRPDQGILH
jgi:hypothetical protein